MGVELPKPRWDSEDADLSFVPTPGGILDGLPAPSAGSSLHLLIEPEDIAGIEGLGGQEAPSGDSEPMQQETQAIGQRSSPGAGPEYNPSDQSNPELERKAPDDKAGLSVGDVAGKIWNLPNSAIGLGYGAAGYLAGWPSYWLGLQENAPGITTGNNAVQFTNNPFGGVGAITIGNTETFAPDTDKDNRKALGPHEEQHTYQGQQLGPFYLPSNVLGGASGLLIDGEWRGRHNWNEVGPYQNPPRPWPK